jgi:hypothetical protein
MQKNPPGGAGLRAVETTTALARRRLLSALCMATSRLTGSVTESAWRAFLRAPRLHLMSWGVLDEVRAAVRAIPTNFFQRPSTFDMASSGYPDVAFRLVGADGDEDI